MKSSCVGPITHCCATGSDWEVTLTDELGECMFHDKFLVVSTGSKAWSSPNKGQATVHACIYVVQVLQWTLLGQFITLTGRFENQNGLQDWAGLQYDPVHIWSGTDSRLGCPRLQHLLEGAGICALS